jgi:hypothetical protein
MCGHPNRSARRPAGQRLPRHGLPPLAAQRHGQQPRPAPPAPALHRRSAPAGSSRQPPCSAAHLRLEVPQLLGGVAAPDLARGHRRAGLHHGARRHDGAALHLGQVAAEGCAVGAARWRAGGPAAGRGCWQRPGGPIQSWQLPRRQGRRAASQEGAIAAPAGLARARRRGRRQRPPGRCCCPRRPLTCEPSCSTLSMPIRQLSPTVQPLSVAPWPTDTLRPTTVLWPEESKLPA